MTSFYHVRVTGVSFCQGAIAGCSEGERVLICIEPDNPFDELALKVEAADGAQLGYIPRANWIRRAVFQDGRGLAAVVAGLGCASSGYLGLVLSVAITDDDLPVRSYYPTNPPPEPPPGGFRAWVDPPTDRSMCGHSATAQIQLA